MTNLIFSELSKREVQFDKHRESWQPSHKLTQNKAVPESQSMANNFIQSAVEGVSYRYRSIPFIKLAKSGNLVPRAWGRGCKSGRMCVFFFNAVNSNFRAFFWLASVTRNILNDYSLFCVQSQDGVSFRGTYLSNKWSSRTNKYLESDELWLVAVYWLVENNLLAEFATES